MQLKMYQAAKHPPIGLGVKAGKEVSRPMREKQKKAPKGSKKVSKRLSRKTI